MFFVSLIVHIDCVFVLLVSVHRRRGVHCFVAVDYHTVDSEIIFCTILVPRICALGPYFSYYGLGYHLQASTWMDKPCHQRRKHTYAHALALAHTILIISAKLLHYLIRSTLCSG